MPPQIAVEKELLKGSRENVNFAHRFQCLSGRFHIAWLLTYVYLVTRKNRL